MGKICSKLCPKNNNDPNPLLENLDNLQKRRNYRWKYKK